jgi:hypothetical protein
MTTHPDHQAFGFAETRYDPDTRKPIGTLAHRGLSKREYFAAQALKGILSGSSVFESEDPFRIYTPRERADAAVLHADELIAALNGEGQANG